MSKIDGQLKKLQESFDILQNQFLMLKNIEAPCENEGVYKTFEATKFYHKPDSSNKFIDFHSLGFPVHKYFISEIEQRSRTLNSHLNKNLEKEILNLIGTTFKNEDYVVVITNNSLQDFASLVKLLYEKINRNKAGRIYIESGEIGLSQEFKLSAINDVGEDKIVAHLHHSYLNVLSYNGYSLVNQNVILLNDEFGCDDALTNAIIGLKPKSLLNILIARQHLWYDNFD